MTCKACLFYRLLSEPKLDSCHISVKRLEIVGLEICDRFKDKKNAY